MMRIFEDTRGWQFTVRPGLGQETYSVFYRKPSILPQAEQRLAQCRRYPLAGNGSGKRGRPDRLR